MCVCVCVRVCVCVCVCLCVVEHVIHIHKNRTLCTFFPLTSIHFFLKTKKVTALFFASTHRFSLCNLRTIPPLFCCNLHTLFL